MDILKIANINGKSITFGGIKQEYWLLEFEDSGIPVGINSIKGTYRIGEVYLGNTLDKRQLKIKFSVAGESDEQFKFRKRELAKVLNPSLGEIEIDFNGYKIKGVIDNTPSYKYVDDNYVESSITILCHYPYWSGEEIKKDLAAWLPNTAFPINIKVGGVAIGVRDPAKTKLIDNPGDVEIGLIADIIINGPTSEVTFINATNNKSILITYSFQTGDRVTLNTNIGEKECKVVRANGFIEYSSIKGDWDFGLIPGENILTYSAKTGQDTMEANIKFVPKYQEV
ncbi:MAG: phage distal tail protein [Filifactoraceae bacterium]